MNNSQAHFAPFLDAELMAIRMQQYLPECAAGTWRIMACRIQHPRYKTYFSAENADRAFLSMVYHLHGRQPASTTTEVRIIYARVYLGNHSNRAFAAARALVAAHAQIRPMHLAELGMVAWRFPADPALPWLAESVNLKQAAALIPKHHCNGEQLTEIDIINYRPEIRCTVRYGFRSANTLSHSSVYGKNYADHHGRLIYTNLLAVSALSQHDEAFVIPTALGYDADRHILWLEGLDAVSLKAVLFGANPQPFISRLCRALSAFQQISLPQLTLISAAQNLRDWQKKARKLAHSYVELGDALQSLLRNLENNYAESAAQGLIHGDFHIEQLALLASGRIALFDFDELALGDPLQDLANFAADLYKHQLPTEHIDRLIDKLFNAYRLASIAKVTPDRFYWQLRGQLLTRAYRAHIQQCPDTSRQVARFIALANRPSPQHSELSLWNTAHEPV